jgi:hypothetical protein
MGNNESMERIKPMSMAEKYYGNNESKERI